MEYSLIFSFLKNYSVSSCLDFGIGYSVMPYFYSKMLKTAVSCLDNDKKVIKFHKKLKVNKLFPLNLSLISKKFPQKSNSIDVLSAISVLEHILNNTRVSVLKEIERVLKKGGYFIFSIPFNYIHDMNRIQTEHFKFIEIIFNHELLNDIILSKLNSLKIKKIIYLKEKEIKTKLDIKDNLFDYWEVIYISDKFILNKELLNLSFGTINQKPNMPGVIMIICEKI